MQGLQHTPAPRHLLRCVFKPHNGSLATSSSAQRPSREFRAARRCFACTNAMDNRPTRPEPPRSQPSSSTAGQRTRSGAPRARSGNNGGTNGSGGSNGSTSTDPAEAARRRSRYQNRWGRKQVTENPSSRPLKVQSCAAVFLLGSWPTALP